MWSRFVQESENVILRRQYVLYCNLKSSTSREVASSVVDCAHTLPLPHWFSSRWEFFQLWCWCQVSCFFFLPSWQLASAPACKSTTLYLVSLKYFGEEQISLELNINFLDILVKCLTILKIYNDTDLISNALLMWASFLSQKIAHACFALIS